MNVRLLVCVASIAALASALAACGGGAGDGDAGSPSPTAPATGLDDDALGLPVMPTAPLLTLENGTARWVGLTWYGHSMFQLNSPRGADLLIDPYGEGIGYQIPKPGVGLTTISHEHPDHNNAAAAAPNVVLRGLADDGWAEIDDRPTSDVRIRVVPSWHDDSLGSERGRNAIFVFETGGMRIVHLGDLGQAMLTKEQVDAIGPVDVLLIPVGGVFTIDAAAATDVMAQLGPRVTIPMHYKTEALTIGLEPVAAFLRGKHVERKGSAVELDASLPAPGSGAVWVMEPEGAE